jgi:hypothetical protein
MGLILKSAISVVKCRTVSCAQYKIKGCTVLKTAHPIILTQKKTKQFFPLPPDLCSTIYLRTSKLCDIDAALR